MPGTIGSAPLLTPWFGIWDLVQGTSEYSAAVAVGLFMIALVGVVLAMYGSHFRDDATEQQRTVTVPVNRPTRRQPRRRR